LLLLYDIPFKVITSLSDKAQMGTWDIIKELIASRSTPVEITEAIRRQLHAKYDDSEVKQSWVILTESDPMLLVRVFCLLPYRRNKQSQTLQLDGLL
jgi:hypothetical protein